MGADRPTTLDPTAAVRGIVLSKLAGTPCRAYLFGSFARHTAQQFSDIDVATDGSGPISPVLLAEIREALEESLVPYEVDLVDLPRASAALRDAVRQDGILWTEPWPRFIPPTER